MHFLALISAFVGLAPLAMADSTSLARRSLSVTSVEGGSPPDFESMPHCNDVRFHNTSTIERVSCYIDGTSSDDTTDSATSLWKRQLSGPACFTQGIAPLYTDIGILCQGIPDDVQLTPASSGISGHCNCETWVSFTARWAVCTCDWCHTVNIGNLRSACVEIQDECFLEAQRPYTRGFEHSENPSIYAALYGESGDTIDSFDNVPTYCY